MTFEDPRLPLILDKLQAGRRLDRDDARDLYRTRDLHGIAQLANLVREKRHGNRAWAQQDLNDPPMSSKDIDSRLAALAAVAGESYEPPLHAELSGQMYLKHIAVARLLLDVPHIVARLCPQVENVCQLALRFGADTLVGANVAELERQARAAGREVGTADERR